MTKKRNVRNKNYPDTWDLTPLRNSLYRLERKGMVSKEDINNLQVVWGEPYPGKEQWVAYSYPANNKIVFTHRAYKMPKWAIDTIMWHEISHVVSGSNHEEASFKIINKQRKFQGVQEWIAYFLDVIGVCKL